MGASDEKLLAMIRTRKVSGAGRKKSGAPEGAPGKNNVVLNPYASFISSQVLSSALKPLADLALTMALTMKPEQRIRSTIAHPKMMFALSV